MNLRKKLVAAAAGLLLAGLTVGAGGTSATKPSPSQGMTTTTTAPAAPY